MQTTDNRVAIYDAAYDAALDTVVADILARFPLELAGRRVLVKPNLLSPHPPEKAVTTHPGVVGAVVKALLAKGAVVMVGDNPGVYGYGVSEKTAQATGVLDASQGCFIHLGRQPVRRELPHSRLGHVMIAQDVLEADLVVNLPKLKTHGLTFYSGAIKNTFGYVTGGDKLRVHAQASSPRAFAQALLDIYAIRPPDLTIMDAVDAMEGNGPSNGTVRHVGKILAASSGVTLDTAALALIGRRPGTVPHVAMAGTRGLGVTDLDKIEILGQLQPVPNYKMPATYMPGISGLFFGPMSRLMNCVPSVIQERCQHCGLCVKHCPVKAMQMQGEYPLADKKTCISCYCCQEMCPEGAIRLEGRMLRFVRRGALYE